MLFGNKTGNKTLSFEEIQSLWNTATEIILDYIKAVNDENDFTGFPDSNNTTVYSHHDIDHHPYVTAKAVVEAEELNLVVEYNDRKIKTSVTFSPEEEISYDDDFDKLYLALSNVVSDWDNVKKSIDLFIYNEKNKLEEKLAPLTNETNTLLSFVSKNS